MVVETSTVAIDSIKVKQNDKILWHIVNKKDFKVLAISYGKIPIKFRQIFPEGNVKPERLISGAYLTEVYLNNDLKKFEIGIK